MKQIARDLNLGALREARDSLEDTRSDRKFRRRINDVMERIEVDKALLPNS